MVGSNLGPNLGPCLDRTQVQPIQRVGTGKGLDFSPNIGGLGVDQWPN